MDDLDGFLRHPFTTPLNWTESAREFPVELVELVGNFPVRCHGPDIAQLLETLALGGPISQYSQVFF